MSYLVYLAGPIDDLNHEVTDWRAEILPDPDVVLFRPDFAFRNAVVETSEAVIRANYAVIHACDGIVAMLDGGWPFGTIREIEFARSLGRPVTVATTREIKSLVAWDLVVYTAPQDAFNGLMEILREVDDE